MHHSAAASTTTCASYGSSCRANRLGLESFRNLPAGVLRLARPITEALVSSNDSLLKTPLHDWHRAHGGRLVEFGGWSMPVQYTTIVEEHRRSAQRVGLFDISHMGRLTFDGPGVLDWLERVTTNHVARLAENQIQYSLMANEQGGVIDDILVYRQPFAYLVVCNASNRENVVEPVRAPSRAAPAATSWTGPRTPR